METEIEIEKASGYIAVHGDFNVLSSAFYNGGYRSARTIVNLEVPSSFDGDAFQYFDSFLKAKNLSPEDTVGMMTAVPMSDAQIINRGDISAVITAGIPVPASSSSSSTVNIILTIDRRLSQSAMANVLIVATEAKTAAFYDLDVRDRSGDLFTGDVTDSVAVACVSGANRNRGEEEEVEVEEAFAGKGTELGRSVYEVVREGVKAALVSHNALKADRPILKRLEERGIGLDEMVKTALELYVPVAGEDVDMEELSRRLESRIRKETADTNVAMLLAAAMHAEEEEIKKGRAGSAGETDAASIVADELIGMDIAEYIGGKRALFNFFYYDTRKPGILSRLGVFMDDAVGGLIAGCMTRMLQE